MAFLRRKHFWICLLLGLIAIPGIDYWALLFNPQALFNHLCNLGSWTVPTFIVIHVLATAIGIPGTLLVLVGGAKFGLWWGSLWSLIGATLGAIAAFWLARYWLHDWFSDRFAHHRIYRNINQIMDTHSFNCVLAVRLAPLSPFNLVNFLFGLTSVPLSAYALGTLVGIAPGTVAYNWLGLAGLEAAQGKSLWPLTLAASFLALLSLFPLWLKKRYNTDV
jgi:uncharacterized membrane protein YdjX (TVP38/TMEM64 family)